MLKPGFLLLSAILVLLTTDALAAAGTGHAVNSTVDGELAAAAAKPSVSMAWYAGWHAADFTLQDVSWEKYTHLTYSFAETTNDVNTLDLSGSEVPGTGLQDFVNAAHANGVKAGVTIGGWTGSRFFSTNFGSAANRTAFVKTVVNFVKKYDLDAVDFDWEYPNNQGIGCNTISTSDTANFLSFLQLLRKDPTGSKLTLSAATSINPFIDSSGSPSSDVSAFAQALDFIEIMNYDVWGSWSSSVGPDAPLKDSCAAGQNQQGSATSGVQAWSAAGFPKSQIVLGVPSYGHSFAVTPSNALVKGSKTQLNAYPAFEADNQPVGDKWDDAPGVDVCGNFEGAGGNFDFWGLVDGGFLDGEGNVAAGIASRFDSCSQTPYVYNATSQVMVSYDNAQSFAAKGSFIKSNALRGFAMWEAGGDLNDILLDSIRSSAGF